MGYSSGRCWAAVVFLALISFCPPVPAEAISCTQALQFLMPCQSFLFGVGEISSSCCVGAQSLARATVSSTDRKTVCQCLKQVALSVRINLDNAKQLPQLCKIDVPIPVQLNVNCDEIPMNDVSSRLNQYKNLSSFPEGGQSPCMGYCCHPLALPPHHRVSMNLEDHSLGMGHENHPGPLPHPTAFPNTEDHSPGMGHGHPPPSHPRCIASLKAEDHSPGIGHGQALPHRSVRRS
ncbi:UNVERIFIED_CONTAM: Non-specific lipid-transfer protein 2A [Sesamum calycinum]|uniref:Non-specific lipid-transfer protein n=1 Tax=Sesamum calycinum TaxID=2727403 RepID=A0AAW2Q646_9LAMI